MAKDYIQIHKDIHDRFLINSGKTIQDGTIVDFFTVSMAETLEKAYQEIENNKNPHLYSNLSGQNLDDLGYFLNLPREVSEDDTNYLYRLTRWIYSAEAGNTNSIEDSLLNLQNASAAEFLPMTNGTGTATIYIIPRDYSDETIANAVEEVKRKIAKKVSPSLYIEYVIPKVLGVVVHAHIQTEGGDVPQIQSNIEEHFKQYINSIPPQEKLSVGKLIKTGVNEPQVQYFQVLQVFIDGKEMQNTEIMQNIETKFILGDVIWV